jgi:hypothetical protein
LRRGGSELWALALDRDHFKNVNDTDPSVASRVEVRMSDDVRNTPFIVNGKRFDPPIGVGVSRIPGCRDCAIVSTPRLSPDDCEERFASCDESCALGFSNCIRRCTPPTVRRSGAVHHELREPRVAAPGGGPA